MSTAAYEQLGAYKTQQNKNVSEREIESRALLVCANLLDSAQKGSDRTQYTEALKRNQRLWTIFQVALCDPENALPLEIKAILLNLSRFVDRESFRAIAQYTPSALSSLIEINRSIATGLGKGWQNDEARPAPPPSAAGTPVAVMTSA